MLSAAPGPPFSNIISQYLKTYIPPRTSFGAGRDGGFADNFPPPSREVFRQRLEEERASFKPNDWELEKDDDGVDLTEKQINAACDIYDAAWMGWVMIPLASGAPPEVVKWQADEREKLAA